MANFNFGFQHNLNKLMQKLCIAMNLVSTQWVHFKPKQRYYGSKLQDMDIRIYFKSNEKRRTTALVTIRNVTQNKQQTNLQKQECVKMLQKALRLSIRHFINQCLFTANAYVMSK